MNIYTLGLSWELFHTRGPLEKGLRYINQTTLELCNTVISYLKKCTTKLEVLLQRWASCMQDTELSPSPRPSSRALLFLIPLAFEVVDHHRRTFLTRIPSHGQFCCLGLPFIPTSTSVMSASYHFLMRPASVRKADMNSELRPVCDSAVENSSYGASMSHSLLEFHFSLVWHQTPANHSLTSHQCSPWALPLKSFNEIKPHR